jgi:hypothetical protein
MCSRQWLQQSPIRPVWRAFSATVLYTILDPKDDCKIIDKQLTGICFVLEKFEGALDGLGFPNGFLGSSFEMLNHIGFQAPSVLLQQLVDLNALLRQFEEEPVRHASDFAE